jgi:peptidyl-prolyl cis-trans isomerase A (cyclophilin A)
MSRSAGSARTQIAATAGGRQEVMNMRFSRRVAVAAAIATMVVAGIGHAAEGANSTKEAAATAKKGKETKVVAKSLLDPKKLTAKAPEVFAARFETSKGPFVIEVHRDWSPNGADRFYNLVSSGFFDDARFFRVIAGFMAQFGINGDPAVSAAWQPAVIPDDPVVQSNKRGMVSFAMRGPGTRTTQLFINYSDGNARLDSMGFSPFGKVIEGMDVVDALFSGYGEGAPGGAGPRQDRLQQEGNAYLKADFPQLDFTKTAKIVAK